MQHSDDRNTPDSANGTFKRRAKSQQRPQVWATGAKVGGKKKRGKKKQLSASNPLSQKLNALRQLLLAQGHLCELPAEFSDESMPAGFFDVFQPEILPREPDDSIQFALAYVIRKFSSGKIDQSYKDARISALGLLFDCSVKAYFEKSCLESDSLAAAFFRTQVLLDPRNIPDNPSVASYLADEMQRDRTQFLKLLSKDCYNADRRCQRVPVDVCSYILARYWADKHIPLWLMRRDAMLKVCQVLAPGETWTAEALQERIKKHKLCSWRLAPIKGVRHGEDKQIAAFEIESSIFRKLTLKKFGHGFSPQKADSHKKEIVAFEEVPRVYKKLYDRAHDLRRQADKTVKWILNQNLASDDPKIESALNKVGALNRAALVVGSVANLLKFKAGWVEPYLFSRYKAAEAISRSPS